jgi:hypothetical protein
MLARPWVLGLVGVALALGADGHPVAPPTAHDSGYEPDSCTPHGAIFDGLCGGTFSQCSCEYLAPGSTGTVPCPGKALYPTVAPVGTYVYHRLTTCSPGIGPGPDLLTNPPFEQVPDQTSCGHVRVTTEQTDPISATAHDIDEQPFLKGGQPANDWTHDCSPTASGGAAATVCPAALVSLDGTGSHDPNGDPLTYDWDQTGGAAVTLDGPTTAVPTFVAPATQGTLAFRLTVMDPYGLRIGQLGNGFGVSTATTSVTIQDDPPTVTTADVEVFWPPDGKLRPFALAECVTGISDTCDGPLDVDVAGRIVSVSSDEGGAADAVIMTNSVVALRARRDGRGDGRTYTIHFVVEDSFGNATPASCRVTLRHDDR